MSLQLERAGVVSGKDINTSRPIKKMKVRLAVGWGIGI